MKILMTGSSGVIGTVLRHGLDHQITPFDLLGPLAADVTNLQELKQAASGQDAIIHLALAQPENFRSGKLNPDNSLMSYNVYEAALAHDVGRVVLASSVHTDKFDHLEPPARLDPDDIPTPDSPYGANKLFMEALGKYYASKGLEVVCIRFGAVNAANQQPHKPESERRVWLSHGDCLNLIQAALTSPLPSKFEVVYGVSNNSGRVHSTDNSLGWQPQ